MPSAKYLINLIIFSYCLILFGSCSNHLIKDEHPEYFKPLFDKVDLTKDENKEVAIAAMNAGFRKFDNPGTVDWFKKFDHEKDMYYYIKNNCIQAMMYTDSMLENLEQKHLMKSCKKTTSKKQCIFL